MNKSIFIVIGVFILIVFLSSTFISNPTFKNNTDEAAFNFKIGQYKEAEKCYLKLLQFDSTNIELHHQYIINHFKIPLQERHGKSTFVTRDDKDITYYYYYKTQGTDSIQNDVGCYGLGLIYSYADNYSTALNWLNQVKNKSMKYYNTSMGYVYKQSQYYSYAAYYFKEEGKLKGDYTGAYNYYLDMCIETHKKERIIKLLNDTVAVKYLKYNKLRTAYYIVGNTGGYIKTVYNQFIDNINSGGFMGAFFILIIWLYFLQQIDVFQKETWGNIIITCIMGMIFSFGTFIISDFINITFQFKLGENPVSDFFYCVFGIGAVEELVKFIPVLIMLKLSKSIDEPIDYIIYASASALGFAFIENLLYFHEGGLNSIHGRALSAVISHMFNSSVIAYGLILCRFRFGGDKYAYLFFAYLIASASHGFYDFWLISEYVISYKIITMVFMIFTFIVYNKIITNSLNNSSYFEENKKNITKRLKNYLLYSLSAVLLIEYLIVTFRYGPTAGGNALFTSIIGGAYLTIFVSTGLSKFKPNPGEWIPLIILTTRDKPKPVYSDVPI